MIQWAWRKKYKLKTEIIQKGSTTATLFLFCVFIRLENIELGQKKRKLCILWESTRNLYKSLKNVNVKNNHTKQLRLVSKGL